MRWFGVWVEMSVFTLCKELKAGYFKKLLHIVQCNQIERVCCDALRTGQLIFILNFIKLYHRKNDF